MLPDWIVEIIWYSMATMHIAVPTMVLGIITILWCHSRTPIIIPIRND